MKKILLVALLLITTTLYAQDKNDLIITDTIHKEELVTSLVRFDHCPGFISGLPCIRYLGYVGNTEPKRKYIDVKKKEVYYELTKSDTVVIDLLPHFRIEFDSLELDLSDRKMFYKQNLRKNKKSKWYVDKEVYTNVKYYVGQVKKKYLNEVFYNNIMVATEEEYVNVYLIYN